MKNIKRQVQLQYNQVIEYNNQMTEETGDNGFVIGLTVIQHTNYRNNENYSTYESLQQHKWDKDVYYQQ